MRRHIRGTRTSGKAHKSGYAPWARGRASAGASGRTGGQARKRAAGRAPAAPDAASRSAARRDPEEERRRRVRQRAVESDLLKAEKRLGDIDQELGDPEIWSDRSRAQALVAERTRVEGQVEALYEQWEQLLAAETE